MIKFNPFPDSAAHGRLGKHKKGYYPKGNTRSLYKRHGRGLDYGKHGTRSERRAKEMDDAG